jgi:hypothetical protein
MEKSPRTKHNLSVQRLWFSDVTIILIYFCKILVSWVTKNVISMQSLKFSYDLVAKTYRKNWPLTTKTFPHIYSTVHTVPLYCTLETDRFCSIKQILKLLHLFRNGWFRQLVPGSLDKKKVGRKIPSIFHLCFYKRWHRLPLFCLTNPTLEGAAVTKYLFVMALLYFRFLAFKYSQLVSVYSSHIKYDCIWIFLKKLIRHFISNHLPFFIPHTWHLQNVQAYYI